MNVFPASASDKLGFEVLRDRLASLVRGPLGRERVARMRPSSRLDRVRTELGRVSEMQDALQFDDPVPLDGIHDLSDLLARSAPDGARLEPEDLTDLLAVLRTTRRLQAYLLARRDRYPQLAGVAERLVPVRELEEHIGRVITPDGTVSDDASPELARLRRQLLRRQAALRDSVLRALRDAVGQGYATEEQPTLRSGRMVIPVRAEARRKVRGFVHDTSATGQTVYIEPAESLDLNNEVRELESAERREVARILRELTDDIRRHRDAIRDNQQVLATFDLLQAKARLAILLEAAVPHLSEDGVLDVRKARNPVLQLHFMEEPDGRAVVPLTLTLGKDYRTLVITGPNAGGKSVAMKTVGLLVLMLAHGLPVPADPASRFSLFDRLLVDIGDQQSIEEDLSTFSSHVTHLRHMVAEADERTLVLIDEAGTGTDPAEGGGLAQAVLERLTEAGARTLVTTHHGALKVFAHEHPHVENGSMQFDQQTLSPTYVFQAGVPGSSYAFEIARRIGLDDAILARARDLIGSQRTALEDLIASFQARNQELAERLVRLEAAEAEARQLRARYEDRLSRIREETDALRARAVAEAERIVEGANARIEKAVRDIREARAEPGVTRTAREDVAAVRKDLQGKKQALEKKRKRRKKARSKTSSPGPLSVGDQVVLDDGQTRGEVLELTDREAVIVRGTLRLRVKRDRLTRVGGPRRQEVAVRQVRQGPADLAALHARQRIDVRGYRVDEALAEVTRLLDQALSAGIDRVEILHGKGTGALRLAIQEYLAAAPEVASFEEAPWEQGGPGVTLVSLR